MAADAHPPRLRVACFSPYPVDGPSVRHRVAAYAPLWAERGIDLTLWPFMTRGLFLLRRRFGPGAAALKLALGAWCALRFLLRIPRAARFDAVILHREFFPLAWPPLEALLAAVNPRIILDLDDATWNPPSNEVNQRRWLWDADWVPRLMRRARVVVAGNRHIEEFARIHGACCEVIPTTYDDLGGGASAASRPVPVLVWIGNWGNAVYLADLVGVLERLSAVLPFRLRLVGGADIADIRPAGVEVERVAWSRERERELLSDADIGIMPLPDLPYERGKCAFKVIQYFSAGLAVVASPVGMNADVLRHEVNGLLADTPAEWEAALGALIRDRGLRESLSLAGRATYLAGFTRESGAARWEQVLRKVASARYCRKIN